MIGQKKTYTILDLDPFGQGVSKQDGKVVFIPKTLPGEIVEAQTVARKKGVEFAELTKVLSPSPERIEAECPHYHECSNCQYLHTDYNQELEYKRKAFTHHLSQLNRPYPKVEVISPDQRFHYRNRVQFHYNTLKKDWGYVHKNRANLIAAPDCLLPVEDIQTSVKSYFSQNWWTSLEGLNPKGHIEFFQPTPQKDVEINVDQPYSYGGFQQVNACINDQLKEQMELIFADQLGPNQDQQVLFDLFGGNGNLTQSLPNHDVWVLDQNASAHPEKHHAFSCNLYKTDPQDLPLPSHSDWFIIDPPRQGFPAIRDWVETFNPKHIVYVSCWMSTQIRDLKTLEDHFKIRKLLLLDMFPGTQHFESLIYLSAS